MFENNENSKLELKKTLSKRKICAYNMNEAEKILTEASINEQNTDKEVYKKYMAVTMSNVHTMSRLSGYNERYKNLLVSTLKDTNLTFEMYKEVSEQFKRKQIKNQIDTSVGAEFVEWQKEQDYDKLNEIIKDTIVDGMHMRDKYHTVFPKEFYDENGKLIYHLEVDIPSSYEEESVKWAIERFIDNYDGIWFNPEQNRINVRGQNFKPERFFKHKSERLHKIDWDAIDWNDKELFDILQEGKFEAFSSLCQKRYEQKDSTNNMLRNKLNDEVIFCELSKKLHDVENITKYDMQQIVNALVQSFDDMAVLVRQEVDKNAWGYMDKVRFTISAYDIATQSTFRDWCSCMHAVGLNHNYVDDAIGLGSIVAFGYNSHKPHKMISRLLINPYKKSKKIAYAVNKRIYGVENTAFRRVVEEIVNEQFNKGLPSGIYKADKALYDDDKLGRNMAIFNPQNDEKFNPKDFTVQGRLIIPDNVGDLAGLDLRKYTSVRLPNKITNAVGLIFPSRDIGFDRCIVANLNGAIFQENTIYVFPKKITGLAGAKLPFYLDLSNSTIEDINGADFSNCRRIILPYNLKSLKGAKLPKMLDLSACYNLDISGVDFSQCDEVIFPANTKSLKGLKLPEYVDILKCSDIDIRGMDFSNNTVALPYNLKSLDKLKLPKCLDLSYLNQLNLDNYDFSGFDEVIFPQNIKSLKNIKLPKVVGLHNCNEVDLDGMDFSGCDKVMFPTLLKSLNNIKLPRSVDLSENHIVDISGMDFSKQKEVIFPPRIRDFSGIKMPKVACLKDCSITNFQTIDFSGCDTAYFSCNANKLIGVNFPKNVDLTSSQGHDYDKVDFSMCDRVAFSFYTRLIPQDKLPKVVDISGCDINHFKTKDLSGCEKVIMPENAKNLKRIKLPAKVDLSYCTDIDLRGADFSKVKELILPQGYDYTKIPNNLLRKSFSVRRAYLTARGAGKPKHEEKNTSTKTVLSVFKKWLGVAR